ncbi:hypothetical protein CCB80_01335 [Armatimonadetes bacterium Uphvl-Ar1]|nr:hypothetical protein CCB80_01335 [Armatimonadetes bacterium Uphvl-Ar1]
MIRPSNIHSVTTFTRNAKKLIQQVKETKEPIALTVNGQSEVVIINSSDYEQMVFLSREAIDHKLQRGLEQIERGEVVTLDQVMKEVDEILGL